MSLCQTFGLFLGLIVLSNGYPIDPKGVLLISGNNFGIAVIGISFLLTAVLLVLACACCRERRDGFKEFRNSTGSLAFTNALASELAIFPPAGAEPRAASPPPHQLPPPPPPLTKPAAFSSTVPDISDWLADPNGNFPRQQLFYQREIGKGWFGKVVEGEARGVKVVVRILREEATAQERGYFLHEAKPFRDLRHRNIATLFARCLDHQPYLLLFHLYSNGDLKSFLVTNSASRSALNEQGICLRMMTDVAEGLHYMIKNGFIHTDLATRNCLVAPDLTVKIGDYGASIDIYKDEYYIVENVAIPIRWCAPETVYCTPTTIETKQVTEAANAWSLGVLLWEIAEFGRLPYHNLTDDQVIIRVFGSEQFRLPEPDCPLNQYLYKVMSSCWVEAKDRASIADVVGALKSVPLSAEEEEFRQRWESSKPNTVAVLDNAHTPLHSPRHTQLAQRPRLPANAEFDSGVDLEIRTTPDSCTTGTPTGSEDLLFQQKKSSPSLTNLQGSLEELSWVGVGGSGEEEEEKFARNVSEAISHLDETLAREATSSSSQDSEEETWRGRIERGEFTEKVREKSKSVTDLMVLTHIDSEGSETDSLPSLTRLGKGATFTSVGFGSEGNIRNAVLGQELQDRLRQLSIWKTDDPFLGLAASETIKSKNKTVNNIVNTLPTPVASKSETGTSSHEIVPDIVVSQPVVAELYKEPETNVNTEHLLKSKPRKFVFVCHESDLSSGSSSPNDSIHSNSDITQVTFIPANKLPKRSVESESSVILGSCEEHTLDYFKGLKTTFVPSEAYSDDDSEPPDRQNQLSDLESPSSGNGAAIFDDDSLSENRKVESDDVSPVFLDNSLDSPLQAPIQAGVSSDIHPSGVSFTDSCEQKSPLVEDLKVGDHSPSSSFKLIQEESNNNRDEVSESSGSSSNKTEGINCFSDVKSQFESQLIVNVNNELELESQQIPSDLDSYSNSDDIYSSDKQQEVLNERNMLQNNNRNNLGKSVGDSNLGKNPFLSEFKMNEIITEDIFSKASYDTYFSIDSGHSSDRCSDQEHHLSDLKNRLEDVANFGEDFQLKRSEEEYGGKLHTPDDERSSDSGFRDKGSLSESVEDTCDEKYNLEDIDAELDDFNMKSCDKEDFKYYDHHVGTEVDPDKSRAQTNLEGWFLHPQTTGSEGKESGWISQSTEDEEKPQLSIDDEFVTAIRNELTEKLPCAQQLQKTEEDSSPEQEKLDSMVQFNYPAQLSPILEEQESNQSSLILDDDSSPLFKLEAPKKEADTFKQDIIKALEITDTPEKEKLIVQDLEVGNEIVFTSDKFAAEEDVLIIDTETNEATLIESPKPQSHLAFVLPRKLNENFKEQPNDDEEESNEENSVGINSETYNLSSDDSPSTQGVSISNSVSSPENGILSGFFLSPCSIRSDLFDSGPPSLPFDLGQSIEEVEEISLCKPNNEAVEIEQELVDVGILPKEKHSDPTLSSYLSNELLPGNFTARKSIDSEIPVLIDTSSLFTNQDSLVEINQSLPVENEMSPEILDSIVEVTEITSPNERRDSFLDIEQTISPECKISSSPQLVTSLLETSSDTANGDTKEDYLVTQIFPSGSDRRDLFLDLTKSVDDDLGEEKNTVVISAKDRRDLFLDLSEDKERDFQENKILPSPEDRKDIFLNSINYDVCKKLTSPEENENPFMSISPVSENDSDKLSAAQLRRDFLLELSESEPSNETFAQLNFLEEDTEKVNQNIENEILPELLCPETVLNELPLTSRKEDCLKFLSCGAPFLENDPFLSANFLEREKFEQSNESSVDQCVSTVIDSSNLNINPELTFESNDQSGILHEAGKDCLNSVSVADEESSNQSNNVLDGEISQAFVEEKEVVEQDVNLKEEPVTEVKEEIVAHDLNKKREESNDVKTVDKVSSKSVNDEEKTDEKSKVPEKECVAQKSEENKSQNTGNKSTTEGDHRRMKTPRFEIIHVPEESLPPSQRRVVTETDLVNLQEDSPSKSKEVVTVVEYNSNQTKWLRDLLLDMNVDSARKGLTESTKDSQLSTKDWPTVDELIPPNSKSEEHGTKPKQGITSTLALMSPDLSFSTDSSKSHSLLSSFSSTPTIDEKKFVSEKQQKDSVKPEGSEDTTSTNGPLPSPEDAEKGWRPTIGQLLELVDQTEGEEMSTSFIEPDESGLYTPDWESDTSDEHSSSSSEFIWKPQESVVMERIEEEDEEDSSSDDGDGSEVSRTEFIPSMWDSTATPSKSAIRSPNVPGDKKRVVFKKEKYQCVYEYPREPSDSEDDEPPPWQAPPLAALADWELGDMEFPVPVEGDSDSEDGKQTKQIHDYNIYQLNYNIGSHFLVDEGELYISGGGSGSEFFPGRSIGDLEEGVGGDWRPGGSDLVGLGELRHTKDTLRLELPSLRPDKGEASILDSGIDTSSTD